MPDDRDQDRVLHSRLEQVMQRVFMIALGYPLKNVFAAMLVPAPT